VLATVIGSLLPTVFLGTAEGAPQPSLALVAANTRQYHGATNAVSRTGFAPVSRRNYRDISLSFTPKIALYLKQISSPELRLDRRLEISATQYQGTESRPEERRLMLRVGLGLGVVYIVFLAGWIWGTRLRSRPPRH